MYHDLCALVIAQGGSWPLCFRNDFVRGTACKLAFPGVNGGKEAENCHNEPADACFASLQKPWTALSNPTLNWVHLLLVCGSESKKKIKPQAFTWLMKYIISIKLSICHFSSNLANDLEQDWDTGNVQEAVYLESTFLCFNKVGSIPWLAVMN